MPEPNRVNSATAAAAAAATAIIADDMAICDDDGSGFIISFVRSLDKSIVVYFVSFITRQSNIVILCGRFEWCISLIDRQ